jgi:hypothetical protein
MAIPYMKYMSQQPAVSGAVSDIPPRRDRPIRWPFFPGSLNAPGARKLVPPRRGFASQPPPRGLGVLGCRGRYVCVWERLESSRGPAWMCGSYCALQRDTGHMLEASRWLNAWARGREARGPRARGDFLRASRSPCLHHAGTVTWYASTLT